MSDVPTNETPISPPTTEQTPTTLTETAAPETVEAPKPSVINEPEVPAFDPESLTLPEGFQKDEAHFAQFTEWAKEAGINQPQAEKLIGLHAEAVKQLTESTTRAWEEQNNVWINEVKADKELGGANLTTVKQTIAKVLDNPDLSDPKFREALDYTGAGNNPAVIRTLYRMAQKLTEGASVAGEPAARGSNGALAGQSRDLAETFYGPGGPHTGGPRLG